MFVGVHEIFGASLSDLNLNPAATFGLGIVSHYILDAIPHWDYLQKGDLEDVKIEMGGREFMKSFWFGRRRKTEVMVLDVLGGVALSLLILKPSTFYGLFNLAAGLFGGFLPDFLGSLSFIFNKNRFLKVHYSFHNLVHTKIHFENHPYIGMFLQTAFVFLIYAVHHYYFNVG